MNVLRGQRGYLWRTLLVVMTLLVPTWLLIPWRNEAGALYFDWDAPASGLDVLRAGGVLALGITMVRLVLVAVQAARGQSISLMIDPDDPFQLREMLKVSLLADESGPGCVLMVAVFGGGFIAMGLDWPWWYGIPLGMPLALVAYVTFVTILYLCIRLYGKLVQFIVTGSLL